MKKVTSIFMSIIILCTSLFCFNAFAEQMPNPLQLGTTNTYYFYDEATHTLTISGTGATPNFTSNGANTPWLDWRDEVLSVVVEDGVTTIGNNMFNQFVCATSFDLPNSLTTIGSYSFSRTQAMTNWDIPFGVKTISTYAFSASFNLKTINLPDTLTSIGGNAFSACSSLESIVIPYSVNTIGASAFQNCTALSNVEFQSLTSSVSIKTKCFLGCSNLKEIKLPTNATYSTYFYGYKTASSSGKYSDVHMTVFEDSDAYSYALAASFDYSFYTEVPIECAVGYSNKYTEYTTFEKYTYKFTPSYSTNYNFYTIGDCDVDAVLYDGESVINFGDDISLSNTNFCINQYLEAGREYTLVISSVKSVGEYTLWVYPDEITSLNIKYGANAVAVENMRTIDDSLLSNMILSVEFDSGLVDYVYYNTQFFDGSAFSQAPQDLCCGDNTAYIKIKNIVAPYSLHIEHSYNEEKVAYTVDNDGYTITKCVLCADSYKSDFVPTPAIKISGKCYLAQDIKGAYSDKIPYKYAEVLVIDDEQNRRQYKINDDGSWQVNTFSNCDISFVNAYGKNARAYVDVTDVEPYETINYHDIVLVGYDFNHDSVYNAKDYAIFVKKYKSEYGKNYMKYFMNFVQYLLDYID